MHVFFGTIRLRETVAEILLLAQCDRPHNLKSRIQVNARNALADTFRVRDVKHVKQEERENKAPTIHTVMFA